MKVQKINIKKNGKRLHELIVGEAMNEDIDVRKIKICSKFNCIYSPLSTEGFKRPCVFVSPTLKVIDDGVPSLCPESSRDILKKLIKLEELDTQTSEW